MCVCQTAGNNGDQGARDFYVVEKMRGSPHRSPAAPVSKWGMGVWCGLRFFPVKANYVFEGRGPVLVSPLPTHPLWAGPEKKGLAGWSKTNGTKTNKTWAPPILGPPFGTKESPELPASKPVGRVVRIGAMRFSEPGRHTRPEVAFDRYQHFIV